MSESLRSIPESWVESLFAKMVAIYGANRVIEKWQGADMAEVKRTWGQGLHGMSNDALRRGMSAMFHERHVPDLPRFREMCIVPREHRVDSNYARITHEHRITPVGDDNLGTIHDTLARHKLPKAEVDSSMTGIEWAYAILRESNESAVPLNKLMHANDAIRLWCAAHHCSPTDLDDFGKRKPLVAEPKSRGDVELPPRVASPHIEGELVYEREPGSDDDFEGAPA